MSDPELPQPYDCCKRYSTQQNAKQMLTDGQDTNKHLQKRHSPD